ncbi:DNA/RNA non-specific endonuclease, partial [uncultured Parabacteroides sp.]
TEAKSKKTERSNKFVSDPLVKGATATNEDYTRTGYDRGHLAPAGDMKWSAKAMRESFYLSNICPQKPKLNRGIWKDLEEQCRLWALDNGSLLIVTGPVITGDMKRLGKNKVAIPKSFYKVLCYHTEKGYKGIGFLFENRDYKDNSLKSMVIPIDSVEKVTGIDFFPSIPDDQEKEMEAAVDWSSWSF